MWKKGRVTVGLLLVLYGCSNPKETADTVFMGTVITMEETLPEAEALAVKDGRILFVGSKEEALRFAGPRTQKVELGSRVLMPGFIDAHGHITSRAGMLQAVDLSPSPYGTVNSIPDLQEALRNAIVKQAGPAARPILANGYDDAIMTEHRHPTRSELDAVSLTHPIIAVHASGHASVVNTAMLHLLGIPEDVKDPEGGHYGRDRNHRLNGKLEENASFSALMKLTSLLPEPKETGGISQQLKDFLTAQDEWLSYGQTTICDGRNMGIGLSLLNEAADKKLLKADVVFFPDFEANRKEWKTFVPGYMQYHNRLKFGGFKFSDDGSPQGKTAWLTQPYRVPPEGQNNGYRGFPIFSDETLYNDLKIIFSAGITAQLHVNGDAAIDQALRVIEKLREEGVYRPALRATLIHVQNSRPDHIAALKKAGVMPSYFSSHVYLWGDWHYESVFGPERAAFISPAKAALDAGITFSIHHDAPVTPPDLFTGIYAAVNRKTRTGKVLGPDQRISVHDAFKAITVNAAYQYHEEQTKGSLKAGKLADLVILDQNPYTMEPETLRSLRVLETIKEGKTVFKR